MAVKHNSHLTAIARKTLPVPTRWLLKYEIALSYPKEVIGEYGIRILDYGCGKCHEVNNTRFPADGYDPHFRPDGLPKGKKYDLIICNYVLCVLPTQRDRMKVLRTIKRLLVNGGVAYVSVRNDKPRGGWGVSSRGTYQGRVQGLPLELVRVTNTYRMYRMTKETKLC